MNWPSILIAVAFALVSAFLYQELKKTHTKEHKRRLGKVLSFSFVYILLNVAYFILLFWLGRSIEFNELKFPGTKYRIIGVILVILFPLLVQAKVFPVLKRRGFTYRGIRLSVDLALLLSVISLFLRDAMSDAEFTRSTAFYFSGIAVYFTFSKALIEWYILNEDLELQREKEPTKNE